MKEVNYPTNRTQDHEDPKGIMCDSHYDASLSHSDIKEGGEYICNESYSIPE